MACSGIDGFGENAGLIIAEWNLPSQISKSGCGLDGGE
jgi:hypothetical protein